MTPVADSRVMTREQAQSLIERTVKLSKADSIQVNIGGGYAANVRFADNRISTAGGVSTATLNVQSSFGPKHAVVATNDFTDAGLERAVRQSEALAKLAPDDPEAMPPLPPQQYDDVKSYFDTTAALSPEARADSARQAIEPCMKAGDLKAAGFLQTGIGAGAVGNNKGLFAYQSGTSSNYTLTVRTADGTGSGWGGADHPGFGRRRNEATRAAGSAGCAGPGGDRHPVERHRHHRRGRRLDVRLQRLHPPVSQARQQAVFPQSPANLETRPSVHLG